ncbi:heavy metal sensor histidine kinase [uncultured Massilia sp.]|uniref:heavy metal sensor histidine kinase n=1 Tax=uncultured Massilia sp. TaxID=169973 RepID=UPI0025DBD1A9|nr:heavy metal sensor histidine kinase [uncultured Massilia sp.]
MKRIARAAPLSLALRLGLLFAAIAAAVFVAVGAYLYQTLAMQMSQRDDVDVLNKAALVRELLRSLPPDERMPGQLQAVLGRAIGQDGVMLEVATADGRVLASTMAPRAYPHRRPAAPGLATVPLARLPERRDIASVQDAARPVRVLALQAAGGAQSAQVLHVTLARIRSDRLAILKRYVLDLSGALAAGTLLATLLGFAAVRHGLRPLNGVIAKANDIHAQRLNTRLAVDEATPELRALAVAFNAMLDRLEEGVQRLSGFAADLAHDMRTPVNALMMQTQVALGRERPLEEYQALLESNLEEYERLSRMIENTLFLARADNAQLALRRERLDVGAEFAHIRDYFEMLAEDAGVLLDTADLPPLALDADPVLLRRAVNNLVSNAIAHTPRGGRVRLDARLDGAWLDLSVSNTGEPIPEAHRARLFERYYRVDPARASGSASGLGLAIVRAIMQLHGGSARVDSAPGAATVFTLRFPRPAAV